MKSPIKTFQSKLAEAEHYLLIHQPWIWETNFLSILAGALVYK